MPPPGRNPDEGEGQAASVSHDARKGQAMTAGVHGGRLSLASETRAELRALARLVAEDPDQRDGVMEVVTLLAADVSDVDHLFDCLTEAVAEQEALHNDPQSYLEARDFPLRSMDRIADSLAGNVDGLLDQLTAGLDEPERFDMSGSTRGAER